MKSIWKIILTGALLTLLTPAPGVPDEKPAVALDEQFQYRWQLKNFLGVVAGLFLPNQGEGSLTFKTTNGHLRSELMITSSASRQGEYFRYGSEIDKATLQPIRAWSAYSWRGESKSKIEDIGKQGVLDVAAGIFAIRRNPPEKSRRMEIWSDGKIYPVVVIPRGTELRKLSDRSVYARHFSIRGVEVPGTRRWKGKMDLWLARDGAATPVEIVISRNLADVRMELKSQP
ncbi:MAG TPA: DUF3108 domain-containing protein [Thermoanaerobaculia bacterium]|nr:DUF3108 domain-containing protein [Thermoanaerobaculia bacterium]